MDQYTDQTLRFTLDDPGVMSADASARRGSRPPRADARRNRARVLAAADTLFASEGAAMTTAAVAREAGVGIGTVFRHFPTKETLLEAVLVARLERLAADAASRADAADPGRAFFGFFAHMVEQSATKQTLAAALQSTGVDVERAASAASNDLRGAIERLLVRAQEAGAVRADVGVSDIIALLVGASRAAEHAGWDRHASARAVAVVCDGLRPGSGRGT